MKSPARGLSSLRDEVSFFYIKGCRFTQPLANRYDGSAISDTLTSSELIRMLSLMSLPIPEHQLSPIKEALFSGHKIEAIKLYREATNVGLAEAKDAVEKLELELRATSPVKFTTPPAGKGCLGAILCCVIVVAAAFFWFVVN